MLQGILFILLIITVFAGFFVYFTPSSEIINPVKFVMERSGFGPAQTVNRKKSEQIKMTTDRGIMQIRREMDEIAIKHDRWLDVLEDQRNLLKNTNKDIDNMLAQAQRGGRSGQDILQFKELAAGLQDEQRLLIQRGQELVSLNNQLTKNRQFFADHVDLASLNTNTSLQASEQRYDMLQSQASKVNQQQAMPVNISSTDVFSESSQLRRDVLKHQAGKLNSTKTSLQSVEQRYDRNARESLELFDKVTPPDQKVHDAQEKQVDARQRTRDLNDAAKQRMEDQRLRLQDQRSR